MSYRDATYVIFDGDKDQWAYRYMRGWNSIDHMDFDFRDAHDLDEMTSRAQNEAYVKSKLRERMRNAKQVIVLVGESTKYLRKFVLWEIELAIDMGLPIIVVNLRPAKRSVDSEFCPVALRQHCAVHVEFKMKIIKHALDKWPEEYRGFSPQVREQGARVYKDSIYQSLGL